MPFRIKERSWYKRRRQPQNVPQVVDFTIDGFKKEQDHICHAHVTYDTGETVKYISRIIFNELTDTWTVDAMHHAWVYEDDH